MSRTSVLRVFSSALSAACGAIVQREDIWLVVENTYKHHRRECTCESVILQFLLIKAWAAVVVVHRDARTHLRVLECLDRPQDGEQHDGRSEQVSELHVNGRGMGERGTWKEKRYVRLE